MLDSFLPATGPSVWTGNDLVQTDDWNIRLTPRDIGELDAALTAAKREKIPLHTITAADFPLPGLGIRLRALAGDLEGGRGFGVVRGIPVQTYTEDACKIVSWGICSYFGVGIPQSLQGDWINHVVDLTDVSSTTNPELVHIIDRKELRTNHVGGELDFHTDTTDIFALFCLKQAKAGGRHNRVARCRCLRRPYPLHHPGAALGLSHRGYKGHRRRSTPQPRQIGDGGVGRPARFFAVLSRKNGRMARGTSSTSFPGLWPSTAAPGWCRG